ncbi:MAG: type II secretion system protein [Candidatus Omnitrophota bacterium]
MRLSIKRGAFTYVELLIALAVMAILLVPVMQLFSHALSSVSSTQSLIVATNLAQWQMEKIKNLNFTKKQLLELGKSIYPNLEEDPLELNGVKWRIETDFVAGPGPIEVWVKVYYALDLNKPVVSLVTLIEDMTWEQVVPK